MHNSSCFRINQIRIATTIYHISTTGELGREGRWGKKIWDKVGEGGRQGGREGVKKKDMGESNGPGRGCGAGGVEG